MAEASASSLGGKDKAPSLEVLRRPNTTLELAGLIRDSVPFSANKKAYRESPNPTVLVHSLTGLQKWAEDINKPIVLEASRRKPTNRDDLQQMVSDLIQRGKICPQMDLLALFQYNGEKGVARKDQWSLVDALFGIGVREMSTLEVGSEGDIRESPPFVSISHALHSYMFVLIDDCDVSRIADFLKHKVVEIKGEKRELSGVPTIIPGVKANLRVSDARDLQGGGMPDIVGLTLDFDVPSIAAVRPLPWEDLSKILSQKEGPKKEEPEKEPIREQAHGNNSEGSYQSRGRSDRREVIDPRDPGGYYKTLGVNSATDPEDIEEVLLSAYRRLARKYHPDTGGDTTNEARMKEIIAAYEFLKNPTNRLGYGSGR